MLVSIVVPVYNAERTLRECLTACCAQTYRDLEIIAVDDGSTDNSAGIVQEFPRVRYVHQANQGPAAARNHGARLATGEWVAFTDSDCVPEPDWIVRLMAAAVDERVVGVGGTYGIANSDALLARMVHEEILMRHERFGEEVDFLGSFNVAYRKAAFDAVGGFDEAFRVASGEDNDLAYRLTQAGGVLRFAPEARVHHYHPTRLWPYLRTQYAHGFWRVKLYCKHPHRAGRGDRYAGTVDLIAPGLALLLIAGFLKLIAASLWVPMPMLKVAICVWAACALVYAALRVPMAFRMASRTGNSRFLMFGDLCFLRDIARGLGMIDGFWHFGVRRKETRP